MTDGSSAGWAAVFEVFEGLEVTFEDGAVDFEGEGHLGVASAGLPLTYAKLYLHE